MKKCGFTKEQICYLRLAQSSTGSAQDGLRRPLSRGLMDGNDVSKDASFALLPKATKLLTARVGPTAKGQYTSDAASHVAVVCVEI